MCDRLLEGVEGLLYSALPVEDLALEHVFGDAKEVAPLVVAEESVGRYGIGAFEKCELLGARLGDVAARGIGDAARIVAQRPCQGKALGVVGSGEHFVPQTEAHAHLERHNHVAVGDHRVLDGPRLGHVGYQLVDDAERLAALAVHHRGVREHVIVVRHVEPVEAGIGRVHSIDAIGHQRRGVGIDCLLPAAAPNVDVRRHMNEMADAGLQVAQRVGGAVGAAGSRRCLDGVDVEMAGEGMSRIHFHDPLQRRDDLLGAGLRRAIRLPEIPRAQVHHRLGEESADVGVVRMGLPHSPHRVGVRGVEVRAILRLRIDVARRQRLDQRALDRACLVDARVRLLQRVPGRGRTIGRHHRVVDVRPVGDGDAPPRHRAIGVELGRGAKRANRLFVIEAVEEAEPLIEILLGLGIVGLHPTAAIAESLEQRLLAHGRCEIDRLRAGTSRQQGGGQEQTRAPSDHRAPLRDQFGCDAGVHRRNTTRAMQSPGGGTNRPRRCRH